MRVSPSVSFLEGVSRYLLIVWWGGGREDLISFIINLGQCFQLMCTCTCAFSDMHRYGEGRRGRRGGRGGFSLLLISTFAALHGNHEQKGEHHFHSLPYRLHNPMCYRISASTYTTRDFYIPYLYSSLS